MSIRYSHNLQKLSAVYDEAPDRTDRSGAPGAAAGAVAASPGSATGAPARAATSPGAPGGGQASYQNMPMYPGASVGLGGTNLQGKSEDAAAGSISPELKAQQASSTAAYNKMFPTGHENFRGGMTQDQIEVKNNYILSNAMAKGQTQQNMKLFNTGSSGVGAGVMDFAKNIPGVGEAMVGYDTAKGVYDGKSFGDAATAAGKTYVDDKATYLDMFADQGKRVANRYGGDFDLNYKNDKLLDYGSYALEAAPQLLAAGLTGGGSVGAQVAGRGAALGARGVAGVGRVANAVGVPKLINAGKALGQAAVEAAPALGKAVQYARTGLQAATPYAAQAAGRAASTARSVGNFGLKGFKPGVGANKYTRYAANVANSAMAPINPIPAARKLLAVAPDATIGIKSLVGTGLAQLGGNMAIKGFTNNLANAARDVAEYRQDNSDAGLASSAYQGGKSMLSNVSADITGGSSLGMGAGLITSPLASTYNARKDMAMDNKLNKLYEAGAADTPEGAKARAEYGQLTGTPGAIEDYKSNVMDPHNPISSAISTSNNFIAPSVKGTFGMLGYREQKGLDQQALYRQQAGLDQQGGLDQQALQNSTNDYMAAVSEGRDPNTDPKVQAWLANATPEAKANMNSHMATTMGESLAGLAGGMPMDELEAAITDPNNVEAIMASPLGSLAGGDPETAQYAGSLLYSAQSALPLLQQEMARSGQMSPEFVEITKALRAMNSSFQNVAQSQDQVHPGLANLTALEPILREFFAKYHLNAETASAAPVTDGQPVG